MKKLFLFLILSGMSLATMAQQDDTNYLQAVEKKGFKQKVAFIPSAIHNNYDVLYHRVFWKLDPSVKAISGSVASHFKTLTNDFSSVNFDLSVALTVDSVWYKNETTGFTHASDILTINLPEPLSQNTIDSVTVFYHGVPPESGFGSFETSSHNGVPVLWTLSEPYGAKEWWPCKQTLTDKVDSIDIYVETPKQYRAASNGKLISETVTGDFKTAYWKHRHAITTYLVAVAVTNYESYADFAQVSEHQTVEILNYVYPESKSSAEIATKYTIGVMELFSSLFIPYPFADEKYGHAQFGWRGGMEHQTMSFMVGFSPSLITHELAHQWFGDYVTCASWQDIWVNEGFAVFCEALVQEHLHPENFLQWKKDRLQIVLGQARSGSVFVEDTTSVDRIFSYPLTYQKGGLILHQLRHQIGDEAFFAGIKNLLTAAETADGFASAMQVKTYFENAADTNLSTYFDNWYYGQGYPIYTINWLQEISGDLSLSIRQTTTNSAVTFFPLHVPILFKGATQDTLIVFHNFENKQSYGFNLDFEVSAVVFDPDYTIIAPHPAQIILSISEDVLNESIIVAPNPTNERLNIKGRGAKIKLVNLIDNSGRQVFTQSYPDNPSRIHLDMTNIPIGFYYVRVETDKGVVVKTMVRHP
jgi:aminopeptidase N